MAVLEGAVEVVGDAVKEGGDRLPAHVIEHVSFCKHEKKAHKRRALAREGKRKKKTGVLLFALFHTRAREERGGAGEVPPLVSSRFICSIR